MSTVQLASSSASSSAWALAASAIGMTSIFLYISSGRTSDPSFIRRSFSMDMPNSLSFSLRYGMSISQSFSPSFDDPSSVQLVLAHLALRVAHVDRAAGRQGEQVAAWVRLGQIERLAVRVETQSVEDDEAAAVQRVAGHERFRQVVQAGAVDDHPRLAHGVDERSSGGVAEDVDVSALGAVHERLADVAVDHQLAGGQDLAQLVLPVAVDRDLGPVQTGCQVVSGAAVDVELDAGRAAVRGRSRRSAGRASRRR